MLQNTSSQLARRTRTRSSPVLARRSVAQPTSPAIAADGSPSQTGLGTQQMESALPNMKQNQNQNDERKQESPMTHLGVQKAQSEPTLSSFGLLYATHVPDYLRELHVWSGYRRPGQSWKDCLRSIFSLHNETLNAWTHLIGFALFVFLVIYTYKAMPTTTIPHTQEAALAAMDYASNMVNFTEINTCVSEFKGHIEDEIEQTWHQLHEDIQRWGHKLKERATTIESKSMAKLHEWNSKLSEIRDDIKSDTNTLIANSNDKLQEIRHTFEENANHFLQSSQHKLRDTKQMIERKVRQLCEYYVPSRVQGVEIIRWPIFVYLICVCTTLLLSALFHTFACHERSIYTLFLRLDCSGIALQIAASLYPLVFYPFRDNVPWQIFYLVIISVSAVALFVCSLFEWFEQWRKLRAFLFVLMGALGVFPVLHVCWALYATHQTQVLFILKNGLVTAILYLIGTAFFVTRIPERFFPGKFDIWFHSHQWWHIMVVIGALFHYYFALELAHVRFSWSAIL
eukprot:TRINITY_DN536_c0_g1_i1.p1 TRINITY_DN536_c0_g1~~TRINITY_DN536_c0_g1_i1.p1  ORF type:complete len:512 (-),score=100.12 TRINITY_DN536_c0_g1_i1:310-1845(-)